MIICLGPICIPLHLLLPFLVTLAHQRGYLTWFKREWVTLFWWRQQVNPALGRKEAAGTDGEAAAVQLPECCTKAGSEGMDAEGTKLGSKDGSLKLGTVNTAASGSSSHTALR